MAGTSFQNEIPPARVNIQLSVDKGGAQKKVELPLKLLVLGDFTQRKEDVRVSEREKINIDKNNFDQVLESLDLSVKTVVDNKLKNDGTDLAVDLKIKNMKSFEPSEIVKQVPELSKLMAARNLIRDLGSNLLDNREFRKRMEGILKDKSAMEGILAELDKVAPEKKERVEPIMSTENSLQYIYESISMELPSQEVNLADYSDAGALFEHSANGRIGAGLRVFIKSIVESSSSIEKIDRSAIEAQVAFIDKLISAQLDEIVHSDPFQKLEAQWKQLKFLVDRTNFKKNVKIEILNVSKQDLQEDFEGFPEIIQSALYKHVYVDEYDTPGGEAYGALISSYEFDSGSPDIGLLTDISHVSAAAHCPFVGSVGAKFFSKSSVHELPKIDDLESYLDRAEYIKWRGFRDSEDSRYVGLVLPRFLLRLPYDPENNPVSDFHYTESVTGAEHEKYLWGNASFAFAANMVRSFVDNGWCVQIRGPESGGKVEDLPIHTFDVGKGAQLKIPTEILIPETREFEFANQGFIPFSYYKNRDYGCFFSANSSRRPEEFDNPTVTANERINARLPYIFLTARLAHYLKVLQRENIGATKSAMVLEQELNNWVKGLVTEMKNPGPELAATHPLSYGKVSVTENVDNPGFFRVALSVMPHFQVEGIDVSLSLVSKMPQGK